MNSTQSVFDDLTEALNEVEEYQKGNIELRSDVITVPDTEIDINQELYRKIRRLPNIEKERVIRYVDELLQA